MWMVLLLTSCLGGHAMTLDEVLATAGVALPDAATEVHSAGDPGGMDALVYLQFRVSDLGTATTFARDAGCEAKPIVRLLDNPFRRADPDAPSWWQTGKHPDALACRTEGSIARSIRLDPLEDGTVRVQLAAVR